MDKKIFLKSGDTVYVVWTGIKKGKTYWKVVPEKIIGFIFLPCFENMYIQTETNYMGVKTIREFNIKALGKKWSFFDRKRS